MRRRFTLEVPFLIEDASDFREEGKDEFDLLARFDHILLVVAEESLLVGVLKRIR